MFPFPSDLHVLQASNALAQRARGRLGWVMGSWLHLEQFCAPKSLPSVQVPSVGSAAMLEEQGHSFNFGIS